MSEHERIRLRFAHARLAAEPLRRMVSINEPLNVPDEAPLSRIVPGVWPLVGEIRALLRALEWEDKAKPDGERQRKPVECPGDASAGQESVGRQWRTPNRSPNAAMPDAEGPPSGDEASPRLNIETSEAIPGDQIMLVPARRAGESTEDWLKRWKALKGVTW